MTIRPINYDLTFEPDLEKFTFWGKEILTFELKEKTKQIVLDAVDLKIYSVILASDEGARPESNNDSGVASKINAPQNDNVTSFKIDNKKEKLFINLSEKLNSGEYKLIIEFQGVLNDKLTGFYRSKYIIPEVDETNKNTSGVKKLKEKYLATTQFEAADARRAFPCIDNPSYKATFDVCLIIDKNLTAISNTQPIKIKKNNIRTVAESTLTSGVRDVVSTIPNGKKIIRFERTPLMSTYLLYMGVGEFEFLEDIYTPEVFSNSSFTSGVRKLRVVTTPGKSQYGKFALDCAKKFLKFYEEYFDYPYPLKKLDLIAIPDFASGAMENWGAITFRENVLLFYPSKSSNATKQRITEVIAHEIVHQWFGNLVTLRWWDDLWLNESFATYMAYKALDHHWPEWKVWDQYVTDTVFEGMALDSLKSSHPIKVAVRDTSELDELFDEIAYEKGGSILRMLDSYLGEEVFKSGLRKYIKQYRYKNAEAQDLWSALERESSSKVLEIMESYLLQVGFPKVSVEEKDNVLFFKQNRFLFEGKDTEELWKIPLVLKNGRDIVRQIYLPERKLALQFSPKDKLTTINLNYSGFYISDYSDDLLKNLGENFRFFSDSDKIGLIHDLFALVLSGNKDLDILYHCINTFYSKESSSIVLHYLISKLRGIYLLTQDATAKKLATKYSVKALGRVDYEPRINENILDTYLRVASLSSLTLFDEKRVRQFVNRKFMNYLEDETSLHPDLRGVIYSSAVWFDESNHRIIKNLYRSSQVQEEKAKLLAALGSSRNKKLVIETLEFALGSEVPFAFLPYAVSSIARNPNAREVALNWLVEIWPLLLKRSGGLANMLIRRILQAVVPVCAIGHERKIEEFLKGSKTAGLERTVEQVLEELRINSRFVKRHKL